MIRVVLDANVFISGLISRKGPPGKILDGWIDNKFELCISRDIMDELIRVLEYPKLKHLISKAAKDSLINQIDKSTFSTPGILQIDILKTDPSDNIYLACALEASANYLVTGNLKHYKEEENIPDVLMIISPSDFLSIFSK